MLENLQAEKDLTAIELAQNLSYKIDNTTNPVYTELNSFEDLIELNSIFFLEEND